MNTDLDMKDSVRTGPWPSRWSWTCGICCKGHELFIHREREGAGLLFSAAVRTAMANRALSREGWLLMERGKHETWLCGDCANEAGDVTDKAYAAAVTRWVLWTDVEIEGGK